MCSSSEYYTFFLKTAYYTGCFIMFSPWLQTFITRKPKDIPQWNCSQKQKNWKSFFFTTRDVWCVHHRWHGTHRCDIQVLATHASTWMHQYSSLLQWSMPLGQRGHVAMVGRILCTKCMLHSNHRLTRLIFQHTKWLLPQSGHFLTTYTRIA